MFEHNIVDRYFATRSVTERGLLDEYGRAGWQLVGVVKFDSYMRYYFSRKVS